MVGARTSRGWAAALGLVIVAATFSAVQPALLILVPLAFLLLGLPPWRPALVVLGLICMALPFPLYLGLGAGPVWYIERGWALVLGAWFLVMVVALPRANFLARALAAVFSSAASVGAILVLARGEWSKLDAAFASQFSEAASQVASVWAGEGSRFGGELARMAYRAADLQRLVYPGMTALASVAGLGVAWWAYRRIGSGELRPLGRLREFRFRDELVWPFLIGLALVLVGAGDELALRAGSNVVLFMGALYALRGAAVLLALAGAPGPLAIALGAVGIVLLYPLVMGATLVIGLSDTWLDFRARHARRPMKED
ncbi:MAG: hypothetical protein ACRELV_07470 [Longimicrobiales bacterium]